MSCSTELPLIITTDFVCSTHIPKFIRLKSLPVSPKYRAKMSNSQFDSNTDTISDLEVVEFPILSTPPISPAKPNISPRKTKEMIKFENSLAQIKKPNSKSNNSKGKPKY